MPPDKALVVMTPWMRGALNAMKLPVDSVGLIADFEEAVTARARHFGGVPVEIAERARIHVDATRSALQSRLAGEDERVVSKSSAGDGVWVPKKAWKVVGQIIKDLEHYGYNEDADLHHQLSRLAASALPIAPAAGEDEVVVKREELIRLSDNLHYDYEGRPGVDSQTLLNARTIVGRWLAGSPTAQESKDG